MVYVESNISKDWNFKTMSWMDRRIVNRDEKIIQPTITEEERQYREVKEDTTTLEDIQAKGTPNIVPIPVDKFMCGVCGHGWTFSRMKTVECCGITYVKN